MSEKIVIVEDEESVRTLIQLYLEKKHYKVYPAEDGEIALRIIQEVDPDLVLLDIEMPTMDGYEVCKKIRKMVNIPIIFVSSRRRVIDKIKSLELGGDDYVTKPFDFAELEARIKANIRRYHSTTAHTREKIIRIKDIVIYLERFECFVNGHALDLSAREMKILILLATHPNQVWSAESLYDHIWGSEHVGDIQTIKVHISNLRRKIKRYSSEDYIQTVRGFGYKIAN